MLDAVCQSISAKQRDLIRRHINLTDIRIFLIYFSLRHPSVVCANPSGLNGTHTPGQSMSDHRTSYQLQSHHVVDTSHKDIDNTTQPKPAFLMETIPAEPCPQSSSQTDCDVLQQLQESAPKDSFMEKSQGIQDNISQPPETPEPEPISQDTLTLYPASPLLNFSQKIEELMYAGTKLSHFFAASPQISTKNIRPHNHQRLLAQFSFLLL